MKFLAIILAFAPTLALAAPAAAQSMTRSFYNERGSFAGSSVMRGNSSSFYDGAGRFSGSAVRHGNSTSFYDGRGRYTGSVIAPPGLRASAIGRSPSASRLGAVRFTARRSENPKVS
jgi:hypothetical protein